MRNTPLLLQLLFWYNAVLKSLPGPRQSLDWGGLVLANNRGLYLPRPEFGEGAWAIGLALAAGVLAALAYAAHARRRQQLTGERAPVVLGRPRRDRASARDRLFRRRPSRWISTWRTCRASI